MTNNNDEKIGSQVHIPVMLKEVLKLLNVQYGGTYIDCTLGLGGHSSEILKILTKQGYGHLISIDRDPASLKIASEKLNKIDPLKFYHKTIHDKFSNLEEIIEKNCPFKVDGVLFDLGVSSPQYDDPWRGFTYREDVPLDMRMDQTRGETAADIINTIDINEFARFVKLYTDEKYFYNIAVNIGKHRAIKPIETTGELEEIVKEALPTKELYKRHHPAQKIFQALRMITNDEYGEIKDGLKAALENLNVGGRVVVIAFNNDEDRIIKNLFKEYTVVEGDRLNLYIEPDDIRKPEFRLVRKKVIYPTEEEVKLNPRARSSKLRVIERILPHKE